MHQVLCDDLVWVTCWLLHVQVVSDHIKSHLPLQSQFRASRRLLHRPPGSLASRGACCRSFHLPTSSPWGWRPPVYPKSAHETSQTLDNHGTFQPISATMSQFTDQQDLTFSLRWRSKTRKTFPPKISVLCCQQRFLQFNAGSFTITNLSKINQLN